MDISARSENPENEDILDFWKLIGNIQENSCFFLGFLITINYWFKLVNSFLGILINIISAN